MYFKELIVWQKSMDLVVEIYQIIRALPYEERFALADQMRRAAISIPSNIAEGNSRQSSKEYHHFLSISLGSMAELETQLLLCQRLGYFCEERTKFAFRLMDEIGRMLNSIMNKILAQGSNP